MAVVLETKPDSEKTREDRIGPEQDQAQKCACSALPSSQMWLRMRRVRLGRIAWQIEGRLQYLRSWVHEADLRMRRDCFVVA